MSALNSVFCLEFECSILDQLRINQETQAGVVSHQFSGGVMVRQLLKIAY